MDNKLRRRDLGLDLRVGSPQEVPFAWNTVGKVLSQIVWPVGPPAPSCHGCHALFRPQVIHALGQVWHPEHFVCTHCKEEIGPQPFFERSGLAYCPKDYHDLFSPRCAYCAAPILDVSRPPSPAPAPQSWFIALWLSNTALCVPFPESADSNEPNLAPRALLLLSLWRGVWCRR